MHGVSNIIYFKFILIFDNFHLIILLVVFIMSPFVIFLNRLFFPNYHQYNNIIINHCLNQFVKIYISKRLGGKYFKYNYHLHLLKKKL